MEVEDPRQFGVLTVENGLVTDLIEKPEHPASNLTSVGVYVFDREIFPILDNIPRSPRGEYEVTDGVRALAHRAEMHYHVSTAYWIPVGFPWSILTANDFLLERNFSEHIEGAIEPGVRIEGIVSLGKNSIIRQGSLIQGKLCVGDNCIVGVNCHISGNTSIGNNSSLAMASRVDNSVIEQNVRIEPFCHISHSVIGDGCVLHSGAVTMSAPLEGSTVSSFVKGQLFNSGRKLLGAILASGVKLQPHVVTSPGVKIAPGAVVNAGSVVREDMSS
jgi:bifunctional UDP-N-acetylglucosamine pyrophosphorylase/glucosamine-1-phosphate N-acetyltransferase